MYNMYIMIYQYIRFFSPYATIKETINIAFYLFFNAMYNHVSHYSLLSIPERTMYIYKYHVSFVLVSWDNPVVIWITSVGSRNERLYHDFGKMFETQYVYSMFNYIYRYIKDNHIMLIFFQCHKKVSPKGYP